MKDFLKKLRSEKGATGIDVIMASATIMITIMVVSMLYVNTSIQTKNIKRIAGATRLITNIAENIQSLSYNEFLDVINGIVNIEEYNHEEYHKLDSAIGTNRIFDTTIPSGYTFYIKADPVYGSHYDQQTEQFDLVRSVDIIVTYKLGNNVEDIRISLTKQRELIDECNAPELSYLRDTGAINASTSIFPIKYVEAIGDYVRTTEDDLDWYDYTNKKWALVLVSNKTEKELFDINGKYTGVEAEKYMWIPAFYVNSDESAFQAFRYNGSDKMIVKGYLTSAVEDDTGRTSTFECYTFADKTSDCHLLEENTDTGLWVPATKDNLENNKYAIILNEASVYGPFKLH